MQAPKVIAEIGCNHQGNISLAHKMIEAAAGCDVDVIKFQKRCSRELLTAAEYSAPHPCPYNAYGETYGKHREALEFTVEQHAELMAHCEQLGKIYSCSVWDTTSAKEIAGLHPAIIKIPSAMNLCWPIYKALGDAHYFDKLHISLGMTNLEEEGEIFKLLSQSISGVIKNEITIYHCTSAYPAPFEQLYLHKIWQLKSAFPGLSVGFSGHHLGIAVDIAAYMLGATWIERHFTLDRTMKGTDHAASLEPDGMKKLVRNLRAVALAVQEKPDQILPCEVSQRAKLKKLTLQEVSPCPKK